MEANAKIIGAEAKIIWTPKAKTVDANTKTAKTKTKIGGAEAVKLSNGERLPYRVKIFI